MEHPSPSYEKKGKGISIVMATRPHLRVESTPQPQGVGPTMESIFKRALQRVGKNKRFDALEGSFPTIACKRTQPLILRRLVPFVYQLQPWLLRFARFLCNNSRLRPVDSSSSVLLRSFQFGDLVSRIANSCSVSIRVRYLDLHFLLYI